MRNDDDDGGGGGLVGSIKTGQIDETDKQRLEQVMSFVEWMQSIQDKGIDSEYFEQSISEHWDVFVQLVNSDEPVINTKEILTLYTTFHENAGRLLSSWPKNKHQTYMADHDLDEGCKYGAVARINKLRKGTTAGVAPYDWRFGKLTRDAAINIDPESGKLKLALSFPDKIGGRVVLEVSSYYNGIESIVGRTRRSASEVEREFAHYDDEQHDCDDTGYYEDVVRRVGVARIARWDHDKADPYWENRPDTEPSRIITERLINCCEYLAGGLQISDNPDNPARRAIELIYSEAMTALRSDLSRQPPKGEDKVIRLSTYCCNSGNYSELTVMSWLVRLNKLLRRPSIDEDFKELAIGRRDRWMAAGMLDSDSIERNTFRMFFSIMYPEIDEANCSDEQRKAVEVEIAAQENRSWDKT
ncbi:hypothetical protein FWD20_03060 [Candidatus Saccharibacteria bacterium]|nr:hypothetical protein [Candidatus Saccharibacteria bacterium]